MPVPQIDPQTGERIPTPGVIYIDPKTGERIDLSAGMVPKTPPPIDLSAGMVPKARPPIDYTALAKSMGAISSSPAPANGTPIDYTALAKSMGAIDSQPTQKGFFSSFADSSGLSTLGNAIVHPIDAAMGIPAAVKGIVANTVDNVKQGVADYKTSGLSETTRRDFGRAVPIVGPALAMAQTQHDAGNDAGMAGTIAGTVTGLTAPGILKDARGAVLGTADRMVNVGDAVQAQGTKLLNKTVGALKNDFDRGANPARGYFAQGKGPAMSMQSIADKAATTQDAVGQQLGSIYDSATSSGIKIPVQDVVDAISAPLKKAHDLESSPGGMGNTAQLEQYAGGFKTAIENATQNGGFTPSDLFQMKRSIADNTNWADPTQFNLKAVRQQQVGAISGLLSDSLPETSNLNQSYMDLGKLANRAQTRAETGSYPLTKVAKLGMMAGAAAGGGFAHGGLAEGAAGLIAPTILDSVPVRSTAASALYYSGKGLSTAGAKLGSLVDNSGGAAANAATQADSAINSPVEQQANPPLTNAIPAGLKGQARWSALGTAKLQDHIARDVTSGTQSDLTVLTPNAIDDLQSTQQGKDLLMQASDLKPGSAAMKNLARQISASLARTKESQK